MDSNCVVNEVGISISGFHPDWYLCRNVGGFREYFRNMQINSVMTNPVHLEDLFSDCEKSALSAVLSAHNLLLK